MAGSTTRPIRSKPYNPGPNMDFYALGIIFLGISTTVGAIELRRDVLRVPRAGNVDQPHADSRVGND